MSRKVNANDKLTGVIAPIKGVGPEMELALRMAGQEFGPKGQRGFIKKVLAESPLLAPYLKAAKKRLKSSGNLNS